MFCTNCGTENISNAKFCKSCGKELASPLEQAQTVINVPKENIAKKVLGGKKYSTGNKEIGWGIIGFTIFIILLNLVHTNKNSDFYLFAKGGQVICYIWGAIRLIKLEIN